MSLSTYTPFQSTAKSSKTLYSSIYSNNKIRSDSADQNYPRTKSVSDIILVYKSIQKNSPRWMNPNHFGYNLINLSPIQPSKGIGATAPIIPRNSPKCIEMGFTRNDELPDIIIF